jgi:hypothetical protein
MAQNFDNHTRLVAAWHFVAAPILLVNLGFAIHRFIYHDSTDNGVAVLLAVALLIVWAYSRVFTLTVQDRVIRLEMRLRLAELLPAEMQPRIPEFTVAQLVSLRFASDAELPALAKKVLDEKINDRKAIKKMIKNWQPDELRA